MAAKRASQSRNTSPQKAAFNPPQETYGAVEEEAEEKEAEELPEAALLRQELEAALLEFGGDLSDLPETKVYSRSPSPSVTVRPPASVLSPEDKVQAEIDRLRAEVT